MRLVSVHPGVEVDQVRDNTGFELVVSDRVDITAVPTSGQLAALRELDPQGYAQKEVAE